MSFFIAGLDLGQSRDYTALAIVEATPTEHHLPYVDIDSAYGLLIDQVAIIDGPPVSLALRHLERVELGTPYPAIVSHVAGRMRAVPGGSLLAIDKTGVGVAVADMFVGAGVPHICVTITGGDQVQGEGTEWRVPKRDLVHGLLVALQQGRFKYAAGLPMVPQLIQELTAFELKVNAQTGHDSYEAWREGTHDDLVLAVALACWPAEREVEARMQAGMQEIAQRELEREISGAGGVWPV